MLVAALTGFATGFSLILAIGAQNAFVLRQGILRRHVAPLVILCTVSDMILIAAGVAGFGAVTRLWPGLPQVMAGFGVAFLAAYGVMRLREAWRGDYALDIAGQSRGLRATLATGAAFTWLNPHVYLDTLGLVGAVSTRFAGLPAKTAFAIGAMLASAVFFSGLGFGARLLAPVMQSTRAWRIFDLVIAGTMFVIAAGLLETLAG